MARVLGGVPRLTLTGEVGLRSSGGGRRMKRRLRSLLLLLLFGRRRRCTSIAAAVSATSFCAACRLHYASGSESCEQQRREGRFGGLRGGGSGAARARFSISVGHRKNETRRFFPPLLSPLHHLKSKQARAPQEASEKTTRFLY